MTLPVPVRALLGASLPDGRRVDVSIQDGTVTGVDPAGSVEATHDAGALDCSGYLLLTAPADPHAHLDKARSFDAIRPPMGDLGSAIAAWKAYAATMTAEDIAERAEAQLLAMVSSGTTAVRSHVDLLRTEDPALGIRTIAAVRDRLAGLIDVEIVALAGPESPDTDVQLAIDAGADLVGGAPHLADDPEQDLRRLLAIAHGRGIGVDLHTDESLDGPLTLGLYADLVRDWTVVASAGHCVRLGTVDAETRDDVLSRVKESGIGIIANPITNLYLQGWSDRDAVRTPRGILPARTVIDAGVRFAAGADNVRDPFNPLGRSDALETAMLLVIGAHLTVDEAWHAVSDGARDVMGLPPAGVQVGAKAELLAVRGANLADAVANAPADRFVIHRGLLVARQTLASDLAYPTITTPIESR